MRWFGPTRNNYYHHRNKRYHVDVKKMGKIQWKFFGQIPINVRQAPPISAPFLVLFKTQFGPPPNAPAQLFCSSSVSPAVRHYACAFHSNALKIHKILAQIVLNAMIVQHTTHWTAKPSRAEPSQTEQSKTKRQSYENTKFMWVFFSCLNTTKKSVYIKCNV